jgi:hypothetical protein
VGDRFAIFLPPWVLPTLDPELIDGCPRPNVMVCLCQRGVGMSCLEFVRVAMWSLAVASVGAALKFGTSDIC